MKINKILFLKIVKNLNLYLNSMTFFSKKKIENQYFFFNNKFHHNIFYQWNKKHKISNKNKHNQVKM